VPLHRYWNPHIGDHFYTTNWAELGHGTSGWSYEGVQCHVHPTPAAGTTPLHRYWNAAAGDHFYTTDWGELGRGAHGWVYEGIQCYVLVDQVGAQAETAVPATFRLAAPTPPAALPQRAPAGTAEATRVAPGPDGRGVTITIHVSAGS
jgi:hypothetical protein